MSPVSPTAPAPSALPSASWLSEEILALYQRASAADAFTDFKLWAMQRLTSLVPLSSATWMSGAMTPSGPHMHDMRALGLPAEYLTEFNATLQAADPVGERMVRQAGRSLLLTPDDFPASSAAVLRRHGIASGVLGMIRDEHTGIFSVVVWHRGADLPPFGEAERVMHQQLLPHWVEGLQLYRVGVAMRELHLHAEHGHPAALVEGGGLIRFAQAGFGDGLARAFPAWAGGGLPGPLIDAIASGATEWRQRTADGSELWVATLRSQTNGLWLVQVRLENPSARRAEIERAMRTLQMSVSESEEALVQARALVEEQRREQALLKERERIMRDLHDGLGAQLVGLQQLAAQGATSPEVLEAAVADALEELRLTVDAAHVIEGDLPALLGNLRYRLQPRLDAAGVRLLWEMPVLPDLPALNSAAALHVKRILLEAITNALRHAKASCIELRVSLQSCAQGAAQDAVLTIRVLDDGVGAGFALPDRGQAAGTKGRGLRNMQLRAEAIGARLELEPRLPGPGSALSLHWPQGILPQAALGG
jgi:signal transduction histidine kinase